MAIVKTLDIILRAQTGKLENDLKKTQSILARSTGGIKSLVGSFALAAVSGLTFANAMNAVRNQFAAIDEIDDTAKVLGVSAAAFERLTIAAEMSGVNVDTFAKIASMMSIKAFEASAGSKELASAFQQLGIDAVKFNELSLESKIVQLAQAFDRLGETDNVQKMVIASKLFGKQWRTVLPLLDESADHLARAAKWSAVYQLPFTAAQVTMIENTNKAWSEFQTAVVGIARKVAIEFAPALGLLFRQLAAALKPGTLLNNLLRGLADVLVTLTVLANAFMAIFNGINNLFGSWGGRILRTVVLLAGLTIVMSQVIKLMRVLYVLTKAQVMIETVLGAIRGLSIKQGAAIAAAVVALAGTLAFLENQLAGSLDKLGELKDGIGDIRGVDITMATTTANQQSATLGSQAAFEQLYKVQVSGPIKEMVDQQKMTNEILEQMKNGGIRDDVRDFLEGEVL